MRLARAIPWKTLLGVAACFLVARWILVDTLMVPSGSMEPFLHGDPVEGDHVVVFKAAYWWQAPRRFEPVVLRQQREVEGLQFLVKRVVAFAGETVQLRNGDLYLGTNGEEPRLYSKTYEEFQPLLVPVFDAPPGPRFEAAFDADRVRTHLAEDQLVLQGGVEPRQSLWCRFGEDLDNGFLDADGARVRGSHAVHDVLLELQFVALDAGAGVVVEFSEGLDRFRLELHPGRMRGLVKIVHQKPDGLEIPTTATHPGLEPGRRYRLECWNIDQMLGVALEGEVLATTLHKEAASYLGEVRTAPRFGAFGGAVAVSHLRLRRDLHYLAGSEPEGNPYPVPPGTVYVLGDHSADSRDSRDFGAVPLEDLVGRPVAVFRPLDRMRVLP